LFALQYGVKPGTITKRWDRPNGAIDVQNAVFRMYAERGKNFSARKYKIYMDAFDEL
jgi:hypothetical protein